jgi:DNA end-binding protein Ku
MKPIWNGAIGFGLVNIPVKLYSATESSTLDLDMLDKKDLSNIKYKRVNEKTGKEVDWENIVKGYLLDGNYVVLEDEDFEAASPEKSKVFSIQQFVEESEIESVFLGVVKPYHDLLIINTIRFPEELREYDELNVTDEKVKPGELKMAITLIEQNSEPFNKEQYKNSYSADLLKIIKQKAKGKKPKAMKVEKTSDKTIDLMATLRASLEKTKKTS